MGNSKNKKRDKGLNTLLFLLSFLIIFAVTPFLREGFFKIHDQTHFERLFELDRSLKLGGVPARIAPDLYFGYGYPIFNFYGSGSYYLAEIFYMMGFGLVSSIKLVFVISVLAGSLGMYLLTNKFFGKEAGILAGVLYVFTPYRAVNLYIRGALTESLALAIVPWVIFFLVSYVEKKKVSFLILSSFFYAFLVLSHNISGVVFSVFYVLGLGGYLILKKKSLADGFYLMLPIVFGLAMSSFFWVPALYEKSWVATESMTRGILDFHLHYPKIKALFYSVWQYGGSGANFGISSKDMSFQVGIINLILVGGSIVFVLGQFKRWRDNLVAIFGLVFFGVSLFLITSKSVFLWERLPLISYLQFPWRFLGWTTFFSCFLGGFFVWKMKGKNIAAIILVVAVVVLNISYFKPEEYFEIDESIYTVERINGETTGVTDEYLPGWAKVGKEKSLEGIIKSDGSKIKIDSLNSNYFRTEFDYKASEQIKVGLDYLYYPDFKVYQEDGVIEAGYNEKSGLVEFELPEGEGRVIVLFQETMLRESVNVLSFLTMAFGVMLLIRFLLKEKSERR